MVRINGNEPVKKMFIALLDAVRNDIQNEALISKLYSLEESFKNDESSEFERTSVIAFLTNSQSSAIVTQRLKKKYPTLHSIITSLIDDYAQIEVVIDKEGAYE